VYWARNRPAVIVIHELPGLPIAGCTAFGQRLCPDFTVSCRRCISAAEKPSCGRELLRSGLRVCVSLEFSPLADRTIPVRYCCCCRSPPRLTPECGGPCVRCRWALLHRGYALAMAWSPPVLSPVLIQPGCTAPGHIPGTGRDRLDPAYLPLVKDGPSDGLCLLSGSRFNADGLFASRAGFSRRSPPELGEAFEASRIKLPRGETRTETRPRSHAVSDPRSRSVVSTSLGTLPPAAALERVLFASFD